MLNNISELWKKYKLKQDILVAKGILADIYVKADWNDDNLSDEELRKANELKAQIIRAENSLKA